MCARHFAQILFCLGFIFVARSGLNATPDGRTPKKYVVNLDLPPEKRWEHVVLENKHIVSDIHQVVTSYLPTILLPLVERIAAELNQYMGQPYADEMTGIAKTLNCSVGDIVLITILYDIAAFCTSVVSQDKQGQIWHSRNLDYGFVDLLRNITIDVDFQRGGKTIYSAVTFVGFIGIMTGQRPHAFTVTVNQRDGMSIIWNFLIAILDRKTVPTSLLVRNTLAYDENFTAAINRLSNTTTAAEAYFIIGGVKPGEGAVISKGHFKADNIWRLDPANGRWFLVETNYDHWNTPPPYDNRRVPATKAMSAMGQGNITVENLFHVMSTPMVLNQDTVYTVVMSAAKPSLVQTWIREE